MNSFLKYFLIASGVAATTLIAAVTTIILFVDPNDYKDAMEQAVTKQTGRPVNITGDITLSFYPDFGFTSGPVSLGNPTAFSNNPFLQINSVKMAVEVMPLLDKEVRITTLTLDGASILLERLKNGQVNWNFTPSAEASYQVRKPVTPASSTTAIEENTKQQATSGQTPAPGKKEAALSLITVETLKLTNASIRYVDQTSGLDVRASDIVLTTTPIEADSPIDISLTGKLKINDPDLTASIDLRSTLAFTTPLTQFTATRLKLTVNATGGVLPNGNLQFTQQGEVVADLNKQLITVNSARTSLYDSTIDIQGQFSPKSQTFTGQTAIDTKLRTLLPAFGVKYKPVDASALTDLTVSTSITASPSQVLLKDIAVVLDDSKMSGQAAVKNFTRPDIAFALAVDAITADRYLPKDETSKKSAPHAEKDSTKGGSKQNTPPKSGKTVGISPELKAQLRKLVLDGKLTVKKLTTQGLHFSNVDVTVTARNGKFSISPLTTTLFGSELNLVAESNMRTVQTLNKAQLDVQKLPIGPLLATLTGKKQASGLLTLRTALSSKGDTVTAITQSLNGKGNLKLAKGILYGFQLLPDSARQKLTPQRTDASSKGTENTKHQPIQDLKASWTVNNGKLLNRDLVLKANGLIAKGSGNVDLVRNAINYKGNISLQGVPTIPFTVTGPIQNPRYGVDVSGLLRNLLHLNIFKGNSQEEQSGTKTPKEGTPLSPEKELEKLGKELGRGLQQLFK